MPDPTPLEEARVTMLAYAHGHPDFKRRTEEAADALIAAAKAEAVEPLVKIFEHMRIVALADRRGYGVAEFSLEVINDWLAEAHRAHSTKD